MRYVSTRGGAPTLSFEDALLTGLAVDGGLYLPEAWPHFAPERIAAMSGAAYEDVAVEVVRPFIGGAYDDDALAAMTALAYADFGHPSRAPIRELSPGLFSLELFHGPTLAFKDFAMRLIGRFFEATLTRRGARATIVGATSGDTGSAAIEAFAGLDAVDVFILFPHGRVSEVQRRQMTTPTAPNVHAVAVEGSFDDCQALVKAMFADGPFRDRVGLAAANSINWARVMAQMVYYFSSAATLGAPGRTVSFSVPTGNFGDIFAGWSAKRCGLPIDRLVIATNENDILHRAMTTGRYEVGDVRRTTSPSMDIQISSNFERALFEALGRDAGALEGLMARLKQSGGFEIPTAALDALRAEFDSARVSESEVAETIARVHASGGPLLDTHSAIGVHAAASGAGASPMVALACAHAAKFPDAVEAASGVRPGLPPHLSDLYARQERVTIVPNALESVEGLIAERARAA